MCNPYAGWGHRAPKMKGHWPEALFKHFGKSCVFCMHFEQSQRTYFFLFLFA